MRKILRTLLVVVALPSLGLFAAGCTYASQYHVDNHFTGLKAAMQPHRTICVLFVHGIAGYSQDDPGYMIDQFRQQLNLKPEADGRAESLNLPDPVANLATLTRQDFSGDPDRKLHVYTLTWEPISTAIREKYIGYDSSTGITAPRLSLDASIKELLMSQRAGDVVVYEGIGKEQIQSAVRTALKIMQQDLENRTDAKREYDYFFVTWSLGSRIVFDCLKDPGVPATQPLDSPGANDQTTFNRIARHTSGIFMLANQLPLLAIIDTQPATQPADVVNAAPAARSLKSFVEHRKRKPRRPDPAEPAGKVQKRLSIVAVSDPNDLLSYSIPDWMRQTTDADFTDVRISVARWGAWIPFLGWTINPLTAHTGYGKDSRVIQLIVEGGQQTDSRKE